MRQIGNKAVEEGRPPRKQEKPSDPQMPEGCGRIPEQMQEQKGEATPPAPGTKADELQQLYNDYIRFFPMGRAFGPEELQDTPQKHEALNNLMDAASEYCCYTIRGMLAGAGLWYNDLDNESIALFDAAAHKLLKDLSRRRSRGEEVVNFAGLAQRICRNHCIDYLRSRHPEKKGMIRLPNAGDYNPGTATDRDDDQIVYTDNCYLGKDGTWKSIEIPDDRADVTGLLERRLERGWLWQVLYCYVQAMLDYPDRPEKALGICYGRVLYMMAEHLNPAFARFEKSEAQDKLPQTKKPTGRSSPKWGMQQMRGKTLDQLRVLSEAELSRIFGFPLHWGGHFCKELESCRTVGGTTRRLADIPYDALCTETQVTGWCNSIHKTLIKRACELILQDDELVDYCAENLPATAKAFLDKGER